MKGRPLLFAISLFFVASGVVGIISPRSLVIAHPIGRYFRGYAEYVSARQARLYSFIGIIIGCVIGAAAFAGPSGSMAMKDRAIAKAIARLHPEMLRRYGPVTDCTESQVTKTASELGIPKQIHPYLLAAFMGREALAALEIRIPEFRWDEVESTTERIFLELPSSAITADHFHESWARRTDDF